MAVNFNQKFYEKCEKEDLNCAICYEPFNNPQMILKCQHVFCKVCISNSIKNSPTCPSCRSPFTGNEIAFARSTNTRMEKIWERYSQKFPGSPEKNPYSVIEDKTPIQVPSAPVPVQDIQYEEIRRTIDQREGINESRKHFHRSIESRNNINLTSCRVDGKTVSSYGSILATETLFQRGIEARNGIKLNHCDVRGKVDASYGGIEASDCTFHHTVKCRNNCNLENTNAGKVESSYGGFNSNGSRIESIEARNNIVLNKVFISREVQSSYGGITGRELYVEEEIEARNSISLSNFKASKIVSYYGGISAEKSNEGPLLSVESRNDSELTDIKAERVKVSHGSLRAKRCYLGLISARNDSLLIDSSGDTINISHGKVKVMGQSDRSNFNNISTRNGIVLMNTEVSHLVKSSYGTVMAQHSYSQKIEAQSQVVLTHSSCDSLTLSAINENGVYHATLILKEGHVNNGIKITVPNQVVSDTINFFSGAFNGHVFINNVVSAGLCVNINGKKIMTDAVINGNRYDFVLQNVSYPLSKSDVQFIKNYSGEKLDISPDGYITNTHGKVIKINDQVFGPGIVQPEKTMSHPTESEVKCILFIKGRGVVKGNIDFENCKGELKCDDSIELVQG